MKRSKRSAFYLTNICACEGVHSRPGISVSVSMTEETLRELIAGGETATVEFKIKAPRPAELAERMCGMANSRTGGVIIFGVADEDERIVGLTKPNETIDLVLRAARMVKPALTLRESGPDVITLDDTTLAVAQISPHNGTLYQASGVFWIRKGTHTVPMSGNEVREHLHTSGALQWETALCPNATLDDFDDERIAHYLTFRAERSRQNLRHTSREQFLVGLGCAAHDPESDKVRPTNIGILMFGRDPHWRIPQAEIVLMRYADDIGIKKFANRQIFTGTALDLIDTAADVLAQSIRVGGEIIGFKRVDIPEYPIEALREAIVNSVTRNRSRDRGGVAQIVLI